MRRKATPESHLIPALVVLAALGLSAGCATSSSLVRASESYYLEDPARALLWLDAEVAERDAALAAMERAVVLQELGEYEESNSVLADVVRTIEKGGPDGTALTLLVNDRAADYRGESFERVYLHTLTTANHLALHNVEKASQSAAAALAAIGASGCPACRFPFTRYLAAVSFEHNGERQRALETLGEAVAESPGLSFLRAEMDRLADDRPQRGGRDLFVFLLLGRGPVKVEDGVGLYPGHAVTWPRYIPRPPSPVVRARIEADEERLQASSALTDMESLAEASLRSRIAGLIAKESGKSVVHEVALRHLGDDHGEGVEFLARILLALADRADLRHWSTLPASCQVMRVAIPPGVDSVRLVYASETGATVHSEDLPLPENWQEGPLFVTRRVP